MSIVMTKAIVFMFGFQFTIVLMWRTRLQKLINDLSSAVR